MTTCKGVAVRHLLSLMTAMDSEECRTMHSMLSDTFNDPLTFYDKFMSSEGGTDSAYPVAAEPADEDDTENGEGDRVRQPDGQLRHSLFKEIREKLGKPGLFAAEVLYDIYVGEYDSVFKAMAETKAPAAELNKAEGNSLGDFGAKLREFMRLATPAPSVPSCEDQGAPAPSLRCLSRVVSDPGGVTPEDRKAAIMKERQQLWVKAQTRRKSFCRLARWEDKLLPGLDALVKRSIGVSGFVGKLNEAHRAFVLSCDLVSESEKTPWAAVAAPKGPSVDVRLAYMLSRDGPTDFCFMFDGRSRQARRQVEDKAEEKRVTLEEAWIVYTDSSSEHGVSSRRKVCLSSRTKEVMYCKLPVARVKVATKPRQEFSAAGEDSTHHTTFTGVPLPGTTSLPRISFSDKQLIFPGCGPTAEAAKPEGWRRDSIPLFWNESKSVALWEMWLDAFDIKAVIDMSPGSGRLAVAAMTKGVQYLGVLTDSHHLSWLTNIVDRQALQLIGESSSAVYQEQLGEHIKEHFADVLDELNVEEASDDEGEGEDDDEGAGEE